ncbi:type II restriction endonuclease [Helicobacter trogontum]|uniref:type II restriction endonuclease n=1 Tax=Helicobacter trogontum TaxID=50960 RepID=UPI002432F1AB|nr:type II restriction endonuclease [Helicobacter trogontum]MCI5786951.1 type II restriction endonuclease [Helicobacter trogontum]MDY5185182.1 type II restriction endonuclease [Helicobacter trogontum]
MKNVLCFDDFVSSLQPTNRALGFYVDWEKCIQNVDKVKISLNHLNFLLGVQQCELQEKITVLFDEYPKAFQVLPLLIAIRKSSNEQLLDENNKVCDMNSYLTEPQKIYKFICESGLDKIFSDRKIKDLNDFVFGIEVGLDTNARKNRGGSVMEAIISNIFTKAGLDFKEQVYIGEFSKLYKTFGDNVKKFDFVIFTPNKTYCIECNFYTSGGSKLNEVARAYQDLVVKFETFDEYEFIWITDGKGWLEAKNKLAEAYKKVEIYNLSNIDEFVSKVKKNV